MNSKNAKQLLKLVKLNVAGSSYEYSGVKYVTYYGKDIFRIESADHRNWYVKLNLLDPDRWETVKKEALKMNLTEYLDCLS